MEEFEFEIVDASAVEMPVRRRKKKTKNIDPAIIQIIKEQNRDDYWKQESRLLLAYSRMNERRQKLRNGVYNEDMNPYAHLVDARHKYEIELEDVFHHQIEDDSVTVSEETTASVVENILSTSAALFDEYNIATSDLGFDALYDLYCRIDSNRDRISDLLNLENEINVSLQDCYWDMVDLMAGVNDLIFELGGW